MPYVVEPGNQFRPADSEQAAFAAAELRSLKGRALALEAYIPTLEASVLAASNSENAAAASAALAVAKADLATAQANIATAQAVISTTKAAEAAASAAILVQPTTINLTGDLSGGGNFVNGVATISATVVDDSHNHVIANVDGLQDALDGLQGALDAKVSIAVPTTSAAQGTAINALTRKDYVDTKAPLASPALTGTPTAPTPATETNSTVVATTAFVRSAITAYAPAPTTAQVMAANVGMTAGGIGAFCISGTFTAKGSTIAGSSLVYETGIEDIGGTISFTTASLGMAGTWRSLGGASAYRLNGSSYSTGLVCLYVRIA